MTIHYPVLELQCDVLWGENNYGPQFFEEDDVNVTVNSERYIAILADFLSFQSSNEQESPGDEFGSNKMEQYALLLMTQ